MSINKTRKMRGGAVENKTKDYDIYVFPTNQISTLENSDPNYKEIGIIHITDSDASGVFRTIGTGLANAFGAKGFDNSILDRARNRALKKMATFIKPTQKVCGLKVEMVLPSNTTLYLVNFVGTLLEKTLQ